MATENADYIGELDQSRPQGSESVGEADDHITLLKRTITNTWPGGAGDAYTKPVTVGPDELNAIPANWDNTVNRTTDQTVAGTKTFSDPVKAVQGVINGDNDNLIATTGGATTIGHTGDDTVISATDSSGITHAWSGGSATAINSDNAMTVLANLFYPVGAIIHGGPDPSIRFPTTTWEAVEGMFVLGASTTYPQGSTGGAAEHTLTISEMPAHAHASGSRQKITSSPDQGNARKEDAAGVDGEVVGGGAAHNNMPPYVAELVWRRTA